jgi:type 1 fimbria pilin
MKNYVYAFLLTGIFLLTSSVTFAQKVNFSGTWTYSETKSVLGGEGGPRGAAVKMTIKQEGNTMSIEKTTRRQSGEENISTENYTLDGKECENPTFGDRTKKSTVTWSEDKKSLTIASKTVFEREGQQMEIDTIEVFTLSQDKKSLSIDYTSKSSRGERKNTFVYDKV